MVDGRGEGHVRADALESEISALRARCIGPYRLIEEIGRGAMGNVYRAEHISLERQVALKVLRPEHVGSANTVERFLSEARQLNQLDSEHIVQVTDLRHETDHAYFVMELLEGQDLAELRYIQELSLARALEVVRQVCVALCHVHEAGIVHRDLKPENIFVTEREGADFVKLIDFGIAKPSESSAPVTRRTEPGLVVGTPQYMAPEQAAGGEVDARTDIYAVGVILFELVTGHVPFEATGMHELFSDIVHTPAPPVGNFVSLPPEVEAELSALIGCCLAKAPADRPSSAQRVACSLQFLIHRLQRDDDQVVVQTGDPAPDPLSATLSSEVPPRVASLWPGRAKEETPAGRWDRQAFSGRGWVARAAILLGLALAASWWADAASSAAARLAGSDDNRPAVGMAPPPVSHVDTVAHQQPVHGSALPLGATLPDALDEEAVETRAAVEDEAESSKREHERGVRSRRAGKEKAERARRTHTKPFHAARQRARENRWKRNPAHRRSRAGAGNQGAVWVSPKGTRSKARRDRDAVLNPFAR